MFDIKQRPLIYYQTESGKIPFYEWLNTIKDKKDRLSIEVRLKRVQSGNFGDCKELVNTEGLYELRIFSGPAYRLYFTVVLNSDQVEIIVLLIGGNKSTQSADIQKAKKYYEDFFKRHSGLKGLRS